MIREEDDSCLFLGVFFLVLWPFILLWKLIKWAVFKIFNVEE